MGLSRIGSSTLFQRTITRKGYATESIIAGWHSWRVCTVAQNLPLIFFFCVCSISSYFF